MLACGFLVLRLFVVVVVVGVVFAVCVYVVF